MSERTVKRILETRPTRDGAGVDIRRIAGEADLDPFLMLDEFGSDDPDDYIAGFPEHPHRGFETVTYMLTGHMEHRDSVGNHGRLGPGDVQWMTAGRGIIHSEMPLQVEGAMRGFQLWVNLPGSQKMCPPRYQEIPAREIPSLGANGVFVNIIAGTWRGTPGAVQGVATDPTYLDVALEAGATFVHALTPGYTAFAYVYEGAARIGPEGQGTVLEAGTGAVLDDGEVARICAVDGAARALLLAGRPLGEPVVQYGPFVMNTREEVQQALDDYRAGRRPGERSSLESPSSASDSTVGFGEQALHLRAGRCPGAPP